MHSLSKALARAKKEGKPVFYFGYDGEDSSGGPAHLRVRQAVPGDMASLLMVASVPAWVKIPLGNCTSYKDLEDKVRVQLQSRDRDLTSPHPVRIRGRARHLELHVMAGACPIAHPSGPAPWKFKGPVPQVELVGFYVEGAAGRMTHHDRRSHLHAVTNQLMGHLDEIVLEEAVLWLPASN